MPASVDAVVDSQDARTHVSYSGATSIDWAYLTAELRQQEVTHAITAVVNSVPTQLSVTMESPYGNAIKADLTITGASETRVRFTARDSLGRFAVGELHDLPESASIFLDPEADMGTGGCALDATASEAVGLVKLLMGRGKPKRGAARHPPAAHAYDLLDDVARFF